MKSFDNRIVQEHLSPGTTLAEAYEARPWLEDILTGTVLLKTQGETASRPLRKSMVLHILGTCEVITVEAVHRVTNHRYSNAQASKYAACARVASRAIRSHLEALTAPANPISHLYKGEASGDLAVAHDAPTGDDRIGPSPVQTTPISTDQDTEQSCLSSVPADEVPMCPILQEVMAQYTI